ncbi:MAG: hypothetical protein Q8M02_14430 [Candidatus Didemnitutus sp.]|nr:hypothetical protein [Candidatus Didemnitutus sp.]
MRRLLQKISAFFTSRRTQRLDRRLRTARTRRAQFASFLESSGYRTHTVDTYERSLRRRRAAKGVLMWATAFAAAWIVIESANALATF